MIRSIPWLKVDFFLIMSTMSVNIFFGLVKLINLFGIEFYYFYSQNVIDIVILSPSIDFWIWSISSLLILVEILLMKKLFHLNLPRWLTVSYFVLLAFFAIFFIDNRIASLITVPLGLIIVGLAVFYGNGFLVASREESALLVLVGIMSLIIPFEVMSLSSWVINAFDYEAPFGPSLRWEFPLLDLQSFNIIYPLIPWLFLILLYCWIWIPALKYSLRKKESDPSIEQPVNKISKKPLAFGLILSSAIAFFISYYPYIHLPDSTLVGVDSIVYYNWLNEMMQAGPFVALEKDRPLFNLLIYFIKYITGLPSHIVIIFMSIILAVGLALSVFWFVKVGTKDERLALFSSFFTVFSFQTTVSIFAYSLANWLALIEVFLLLIFLLKSFEKPSWNHILVSTSIGMALLLTHLYTWNVLMAVLSFYLFWGFIRKPREKSDIRTLIILLVANLSFYAIYTLMPFGKGVSGGEGGITSSILSNLSISNPFNLQNGLTAMVQLWVGGLFANPLLLVLSIIGIFSIFDFSKRFNRITLLLIMLPSLALLALSPESEVLYYRFVYLVPFQILAAMGFQWITKKMRETQVKLKTNEMYFYMLEILLITLITLFLFNYSLRSVDQAMIHPIES